MESLEFGGEFFGTKHSQGDWISRGGERRNPALHSPSAQSGVLFSARGPAGTETPACSLQRARKPVHACARSQPAG